MRRAQPQRATPTALHARLSRPADSQVRRARTARGTSVRTPQSARPWSPRARSGSRRSQPAARPYRAESLAKARAQLVVDPLGEAFDAAAEQRQPRPRPRVIGRCGRHGRANHLSLARSPRLCGPLECGLEFVREIHGRTLHAIYHAIPCSSPADFRFWTHEGAKRLCAAAHNWFVTDSQLAPRARCASLILLAALQTA